VIRFFFSFPLLKSLLFVDYYVTLFYFFIPLLFFFLKKVLEMGIPKYNEACRGIVMRYSSEWERTVSRLGRWIDFKNDYKTLDATFMESVWWVFRQLWEKDLVYRGFKVMPYSYACSTPLCMFLFFSHFFFVLLSSFLFLSPLSPPSLFFFSFFEFFF
jgi:hypothetical protein